jgi:hypothetical protein
MPPVKTQNQCHCTDHDSITEMMGEIRNDLKLLIAAMYGKLGDVDGDGVGVIPRVQNIERRVTDLEGLVVGMRRGAFRVFIQVLPWLLVVFMAGLVLLLKTGKFA